MAAIFGRIADTNSNTASVKFMLHTLLFRTER